MNEIKNSEPSVLLLNDVVLSKIFINGDKFFNNTTNSKILNLTILYIHMSGRFDVPLF